MARIVVAYTTTVTSFQSRTVCCTDCGERYAYDSKAEGQGYTSKNFWFGTSYDNDRELRTYRDGQAVTVHHHPDDPSLSVVQPGLKAPNIYVLAGVGVAAILVGLTCLALGRLWWTRVQAFIGMDRLARRQLWRTEPVVTGPRAIAF